MICPHCGIGIHIKFDCCCFKTPQENGLQDETGCFNGNVIWLGYCPSCEKAIVYMSECSLTEGYRDELEIDEEHHKEMIYPKFPKQSDISECVPSVYAELYFEAEQVCYISPRASATLSRYLLQRILHEELKITKRNLEDEISELEKLPNMPSFLIEMLQIMRKVANFGAHPKKSTHTGEIIDVNTGEAEIMLDLIQELFDVVFIKPKKQEEKLAEITEKYGITFKH